MFGCRCVASISCSCDELCLIGCPRYRSFLVLNCLTISRSVPIILNTFSLVIFSVHDIFIGVCANSPKSSMQSCKAARCQANGERAPSHLSIKTREIT